jgi:hypothetical protein
MGESTKDQQQPQRGFSSRWILDGRQRSTAVAGDARAAANAIDTDGDGVADTLALRVDTDRPSASGRFATWIARSVVTVVLVAAIVVAAAASAAYLQSRDELDRATEQLSEQRGVAERARADADRAEARIATLESESTESAADVTAVTAERDELELEVRVLRRMLLDAERRAAGSDSER